MVDVVLYKSAKPFLSVGLEICVCQKRNGERFVCFGCGEVAESES